MSKGDSLDASIMKPRTFKSSSAAEYRSMKNVQRTLEYRDEGLPPKQKEVLQDLHENGTLGFRESIATLDRDEQSEMVNFLCDQYLSLRDFSERLNKLSLFMRNTQKAHSTQELQSALHAEIPRIMFCECIYVWIYNEVGGSLQYE
mmetsp:Transcript_37935/g.42994  ORF Transcript_37935/g.42994 Transcript_37935/m.42994 type:complete len:146 (+) Transcript_37935:773-1210(+)